jgi:hypothetical protein
MTSLSTQPSVAARPLAPVPDPPPRQDDLELPTDAADLEAWIVAVLRAAGPERLAQAIAAAETLAAERFPAKAVVHAMRRALTVHLTER